MSGNGSTPRDPAATGRNLDREIHLDFAVEPNHGRRLARHLDRTAENDAVAGNLEPALGQLPGNVLNRHRAVELIGVGLDPTFETEGLPLKGTGENLGRLPFLDPLLPPRFFSLRLPPGGSRP